MKISAITAKNFIGAVDVDLKLSCPVLLVCGKNHSGKSSIAQAVRMALTGEPSRVVLKKEYKQLVSDDAEVGYAVVEHDGGQSAITIPNGAHEQTGSVRPSELLPFVLDAQRFANLDANERRMVLFALTGISITGDEVIRRMYDRGCCYQRSTSSPRICAPAATQRTKRPKPRRATPRPPGGRSPARHTEASRPQAGGQMRQRQPAPTSCLKHVTRCHALTRRSKPTPARSATWPVAQSARQSSLEGSPSCARQPANTHASPTRSRATKPN
ncbi:MAG: AAA family ATPase [Sulfuritalea sp.]|nr:AAA family ATPase [Sulfuritalea sp.]